MDNLAAIAKLLISLGLLLLIIGAVVLLVAKIGGISGLRLPGDIYIKKENFTFYFPITTFLLISLILTIIVNLIFRR